MKFKIDENLPKEIAELLRDSGHEADTVRDEHLDGEADPVIAQTCKHEGRILITLDLDFSDLREYQAQDFPGLIVLRLKQQDKPHVIRVAARLIDLLSTNEPSGQLWIVSETRVRIRE